MAARIGKVPPRLLLEDEGGWCTWKFPADDSGVLALDLAVRILEREDAGALTRERARELLTQEAIVREWPAGRGTPAALSPPRCGEGPYAYRIGIKGRRDDDP